MLLTERDRDAGPSRWTKPSPLFVCTYPIDLRGTGTLTYGPAFLLVLLSCCSSCSCSRSSIAVLRFYSLNVASLSRISSAERPDRETYLSLPNAAGASIGGERGGGLAADAWMVWARSKVVWHDSAQGKKKGRGGRHETHHKIAPCQNVYVNWTREGI